MEEIQIQTSEGVVHSVDRDLLKSSSLFELMFEGYENDGSVIPLEGIDDTTFQLVCKYLKNNQGKIIPEIECPIRAKSFDKIKGIAEHDAEFISGITQVQLYSLASAANYLGIPSLMKLCCARIALEMRGKTWQELEAEYDIEGGISDSMKKRMDTEREW